MSRPRAQERAHTACTLATWDEGEDEGTNADSMERGVSRPHSLEAHRSSLEQQLQERSSLEMEAANRCAAELLEASNATAAAAAAADAAARCEGAAPACASVGLSLYSHRSLVHVGVGPQKDKGWCRALLNELCAILQCASWHSMRAHIAGMRKPAGKIIGAAEVDRELKDRNRGFGAYDIPFLGPTGDRMTKDASDEQVLCRTSNAFR